MQTISIDEILRPKPSYPTYPPYHSGLYLEEYFLDFAERNQERFSKLKRKYMPVFWTSCYNNGLYPEWEDNIDRGSRIHYMQEIFNAVNQEDEYFTICQYADAPLHEVPKNTLIFSAGGNYSGTCSVVPIPLVCGNIPKTETKEKDILVSFVGSTTHPVREEIVNTLTQEDVIIKDKGGWNISVGDDDLKTFIDTTNRSKFALCPRGYGPTSFRLYEVMQLGAIPVYVSNDLYLPWSDELNWEEFSVLVSESDINNLYDRLNNIDDEEYMKMKNKLQEIYDNYFTLEGTCENILKRLENGI